MSIEEMVWFEKTHHYGGWLWYTPEFGGAFGLEEAVVRVVQGEVIDVAVAIRKDSPTYGQWLGELLSVDNKKQLWIRTGFTHGFLMLSEMAEFLYKTTDYWSPEHEQAIVWNDDATLNTEWPSMVWCRNWRSRMR